MTSTTVAINDKSCLITVPDIPATELLSLLQTEKQASLDKYMQHWDFHRRDYYSEPKNIPGRGRTFATAIWTPKQTVYAESILSHFRKIGYFGHSAAFVQWLRESEIEGHHACMLEERDSPYLNHTHRAIPYSVRSHKHHCVRHAYRHHPFDERWSFVAFREVKAP